MKRILAGLTAVTLLSGIAGAVPFSAGAEEVSIAEAYKKALKDNTSSYMTFPQMYSLHDLTGDGIPELIIEVSVGSSDGEFAVYTYENGGVKGIFFNDWEEGMVEAKTLIYSKENNMMITFHGNMMYADRGFFRLDGTDAFWVETLSMESQGTSMKYYSSTEGKSGVSISETEYNSRMASYGYDLNGGDTGDYVHLGTDYEITDFTPLESLELPEAGGDDDTIDPELEIPEMSCLFDGYNYVGMRGDGPLGYLAVWDAVEDAEGYEVRCFAYTYEGEIVETRTEQTECYFVTEDLMALDWADADYSVRAFRTVDGEKVYSDWSLEHSCLETPYYDDWKSAYQEYLKVFYTYHKYSLSSEITGWDDDLMEAEDFAYVLFETENRGFPCMYIINQAEETPTPAVDYSAQMGDLYNEYITTDVLQVRSLDSYDYRYLIDGQLVRYAADEGIEDDLGTYSDMLLEVENDFVIYAVDRDGEMTYYYSYYEYDPEEEYFKEVEDTSMTQEEIAELLAYYQERLTEEYEITGKYALNDFSPFDAYPEPGDVNCSGDITTADATAALKAIAELGSSGTSGLTPAQEAAADVDGDGDITPADVTIILRFIVEQGAGNHDITIKDLVG